MNGPGQIDASELYAAMQRADREQDDATLRDLQRQLSALERSRAEDEPPSRWALREKARRAWGDATPGA